MLKARHPGFPGTKINGKENKEEQTCSKGLAENLILPAKLGELIASMAENLKLHMKALVMDDQNSRFEYDAYEKLSRELEEISAMLKNTADQMAEYRDLPMGKHDMTVMTDLIIRETFEKFVSRKRELNQMLQKMHEQDEELLAQMQDKECIGPTS